MAPNLRTRSGRINYNEAEMFPEISELNEQGTRAQDSDEESQPSGSPKRGKRKMSSGQNLASRRNTSDRPATRAPARRPRAAKKPKLQPDIEDDVAMNDAPPVEPATQGTDSNDVPMRDVPDMPTVLEYADAGAAIAPDQATRIPSRWANVVPPSRKYVDKGARLAATNYVIEAQKNGNGKQASSQTVPKSKAGYSVKLNGGLPPLSKVEEIFDDLLKNAFKLGLGDAIQTLLEASTTVTVATMCSGTESPLLALMEMKRALKLQFPAMKSTEGLFDTRHVFSAEIEPFKQSYIARNFPSTTIFRDVREMAKDDEASTVYGSGRAVPRNIDILVAGFSCVDFSSLNKKRKTLLDEGESGATFMAILQYAQRSNVKVVILENVTTAPWADLQALWENNKTFWKKAKTIAGKAYNDKIQTLWGEHPGFACEYVKVDSADFYIPHTRNRCYMVCLNKKFIRQAKEKACQWRTMVESLQRRASCPVEAFLLSKDDMRLIHGREQMVQDGRTSNKPYKEVKWELSRARHTDYRDRNHLGTGRPTTLWVDGGSCKPVDYWDHRWHKAQVERIWDSLEINVLRACSTYGTDWLHKSRIVDISQNIDRCLDAHPCGVVGCLTSTGIHWLSTRGGPLIGREALILQGLPVNQMILTRETEKELLDLAGNAMTSTVVGAALIAAITVTCREPERSQRGLQIPFGHSDEIEAEDSSEIEDEDSEEMEDEDSDETEDEDSNEAEDVIYRAMDLYLGDVRYLVLGFTFSLVAIVVFSLAEIVVAEKENTDAIAKIIDEWNQVELQIKEITDAVAKIVDKLLNQIGLGIKFMDIDKEGNIKSFDMYKEEELVHERAPLKFREAALKPSRQLDLSSISQHTALELIDQARYTVALCCCDGRIHVTSRRIRRCVKCFHTTCERCGGNPQHEYGSYGIDYASPRKDPQTFEDLIKNVLPMQIRLTNLDIKTLANVQNADDDEIWVSIVNDLAALGVEDLHYRSAVRNEKWTVTFSSFKHRLDLVFSGAKDIWRAIWFLYALPEASEPVKSVKRKTLESPIARMEPEDDILSGSWHFRVPSTTAIKVRISGKGTKVPAWEAKLGLTQTKFAEMMVYDKLSITLAGPLSKREPKVSILGEYELLANCGTACHSLYKRLQIDETAEPLFLFLDPDRYGQPLDDCFVFARETCRLAYQEQRHVIARLSNTWRPTALSTDAVECFFDSRWVPVAADLKQSDGSAQPCYAVIKPSYEPKIALPIIEQDQKPDCAAATYSILSCNVPLGPEDFKEWQGSEWITIEQPYYSAVLHELFFVTNRVRDLDDFPDHWRSLELPAATCLCSTCAPRPPELKWGAKGNSNRWRIVPYEHEDQAKDFEDLMVSRPKGLVLQAYKDHGNMTHFRVGLNVATLAHRALANLHGFDTKGPLKPQPVKPVKPVKPVNATWRLDVRYQHRKQVLPRFYLPHNRDDPELPHIFPERHLQLRPEQRRSLAWMVARESAKTEQFVRQEIVESIIPELGFRAEVKVQQALDSAKGGVLADEVGYGKTITTLALIDVRSNEAMQHAKKPCKGLIPTKATLVIVPSTLLKQWEYQITLFYGTKYTIVVMPSVVQLNKYSVKEIQEADIVIVAWGMFERDTYLSKIAYVAAIPTGPPATAGRAFAAWLREASIHMSRTLEAMKTAESNGELEKYGAILNQRNTQNQDDPKYTRRLPTRRTKGAQFDMENKRFQEKKATGTAAVDHIKESGGEAARVKLSDTSFNFHNCDGQLQNIKALPLHAYFFNRIVTDEYTYVGPKLYRAIVTIPTLYRWVLSGTPLLDNFDNIKELAGLIGVNLGIDDDTIESMSSANVRKCRAEMTSAEQFRGFEEKKSPVWHAGRHKHAQAFLDFFVRQNRAEIEEIKCQEYVIALRQHPVERAMYLEQEQQVRGQEMRLIRTGTSKMQKPQVSRLSTLLKNSTTAEEALLKNAAFSEFGGGTRKTPDAACEHVIDQRLSSLNECISDIRTQFEKATWLLKKCNAEFQDEKFAAFRSLVIHGQFGDEDASQLLLDLLDEAEQNYDEEHGHRFFLPEKEWEKRQKENNERLKQERKEKKARDKAARAAQKEKEKEARKKAKEEQAEQAEEEREPDEAGEHAAAEEAREVDAAEDMAIEDSWEHLFVDILPLTPADSRDSLRALAGRLHGLTRELVEWLRGVRYLLAVRHVQKAQVPKSTLICTCNGCKQVITNVQEVAVLGKCGHIACADCLEVRGSELHCVEEDCTAPAHDHQVHRATALGVDSSAPIQFGSKTDAIIILIQSIPIDEQVLLFVQWSDLGHQLEMALDTVGIPYYSLLQGAEKDRNKAMNDFQTNPEASTKDYRQILVLNSSDESAAGANLTGANHVIFVSPLLAGSQHDFDQSYTQCVGRARRYGQQKTVYVYKFVALYTHDVDEYETRLGSRLICTNNNEWTFKRVGDLTTAEERDNQWGTGFLRRTMDADDA